MLQRSSDGRAREWLARWSELVPLFGAEFILWMGFGALLPILPIYFVDQGIDLATLGVIIAAWPAARLVGEPVFGVLADRTRRVPLMVVGLVGSGIFAALPVIVSGPAAFTVLRALAGLSASMYDPAARGYLVDAGRPDRRGEAFGLYGAAQTGGLLLGPAAGGLGAVLLGDIRIVFVIAGVAGCAAAVAVALTLHELPRGVRGPAAPPPVVPELRPEPPIDQERAARAAFTGEPATCTDAQPASLANRVLMAAVVLNFGGFFAGGTYEVIWSLFLASRGFGVEFISFTFALWGVPVFILSPFVGRRVDSLGSAPFIVTGSLAAISAGILYPQVGGGLELVAIVLLEACGWAMINPALYAIVPLGSPAGRTSTAQGLFGSAGTAAFILSSLAAGRLFAVDPRYPFWLFAMVLAVCLVISVSLGWRTMRRSAAGLVARTALDEVPR